MSEPHTHTETVYLLIVETDQYAGNFEREMCAYMTGRIGDCEVGDEEALTAKKELSKEVFEWCDQCIKREPDDHGCYRPVKMGDDTTTLHIFLEELPPAEVFQVLKDRAAVYGRSGVSKITVSNVRLVKTTTVTTYTEEDVEL